MSEPEQREQETAFEMRLRELFKSSTHAPTEKSEQRSLRDMAADLEKRIEDARLAKYNALQKRSDLGLIFHQSHWHMRGVLYHAQQVLSAYLAFTDEVAARARATPSPDVIIMFAPAFQTMLFEFYALVNLARITMDNLRMFLRPVFATPLNQIPKSITKILKGKTNCPIYQALVGHPALEYLCDLRNCLVHFRTFATSDNAIVIGDHFPEDEQKKLPLYNDWTKPMARATFRLVENGVVVNVFLPDRIFDHSDGAEKLVEFTYASRFNLLSQSMYVAAMIQGVITTTWILLIDPERPSYYFSRN